MKFEDAFFEFAAGKLNQLPPSDVPEIVFSGKSNVGKSSLINKILNLWHASALRRERREPLIFTV